MATGVGPGRHGLFNFIEYVPTRHTIRVPDSTRRRMPTIWELAGHAGQRCCILRVPMTFPASPANGWLVAALRPDAAAVYFAGDKVKHVDYNDNMEGTAVSISKDDGKSWSPLNVIFSS